MNKLMENKIQISEAWRQVDEQPISSSVGRLCKESYLKATNKHKGAVDSSGENQKLLSAKESRAQKPKGLSTHSGQCRRPRAQMRKFQSANGFDRSSTLRTAMSESDLLMIGAKAVVGADVFLLPQVIDNPELAGIKRTMALSIVATRFEVDAFSLTKDDEGARDVSLALGR